MRISNRVNDPTPVQIFWEFLCDGDRRVQAAPAQDVVLVDDDLDRGLGHLREARSVVLKHDNV